MKRPNGLTIIEVLIALIVVGVAFAALALVQANNLKMTTNARLTSVVKAAANQELESIMAKVLATTGSGASMVYSFNNYYWTCPTQLDPPSTALAVTTRPDCSDTRDIGDVDVTYQIVGEAGVAGEGVLTVTVTAVHRHGGQRLTLGDRVTCYDVYPSPTATAPEPCPLPTQSGGGRP